MDYMSGYHELAQIIKGVPIQCMVRLVVNFARLELNHQWATKGKISALMAIVLVS